MNKSGSSAQVFPKRNPSPTPRDTDSTAESERAKQLEQSQTVPQTEAQPGTESRRPGLTVFLTGLPAAGKTSIARELASRLTSVGYYATLLDGDELRTLVSSDLGFSSSDHEANLQRAAIIAAEVVKQGGIVICSFIAPYEQSRREIRETMQRYGRFFLVHVSTPPDECERRNFKGLYRKARAGLLSSFTGISDVYEVPSDCDIAIDTTGLTVSEAAERVGRGLTAKGLLAGLWLAAGLHPTPAPAATHGNAHAVARVRKEGRRARLFQDVLRAMAERRVTLSEVARKVGVERHTLEKVVRSTTGQSFRQLQRTLLLERAKVLLAQEKSIKEVAFELGFGHPQSFHRFVRKSSGGTPSSLRGKAS